MRLRSVILALLLLSAGFFTECSKIVITNPAKGQEHVVTPIDLKVSHTGCGTVVQNSFTATLDNNDISSAFSYSAGQWLAADYHLTPGSHHLAVHAEVSTGANCYSQQDSDARTFIVYDKTCIRGTVLKYFQDPNITSPLVEGTVTVKRSGTETVVGEKLTDASGQYCIDDIPLGMLVDIFVYAIEAGGHCSGDKKKVDLGVTHRECPDCVIADFTVRCQVD